MTITSLNSYRAAPQSAPNADTPTPRSGRRNHGTPSTVQANQYQAATRARGNIFQEAMSNVAAPQYGGYGQGAGQGQALSLSDMLNKAAQGENFFDVFSNHNGFGDSSKINQYYGAPSPLQQQAPSPSPQSYYSQTPPSQYGQTPAPQYNQPPAPQYNQSPGPQYSQPPAQHYSQPPAPSYSYYNQSPAPQQPHSAYQYPQAQAQPQNAYSGYQNTGYAQQNHYVAAPAQAQYSHTQHSGSHAGASSQYAQATSAPPKPAWVNAQPLTQADQAHLGSIPHGTGWNALTPEQQAAHDKWQNLK